MLKREMSRFSVKTFCLAVMKNFVGEPFCAVFQRCSVCEKVIELAGTRYYQDFPVKLFASECR